MGNISNCCGGASQVALTPGIPEHQHTLTIYGDYFNADTRALLAVCLMADVEHTFALVDCFK